MRRITMLQIAAVAGLAVSPLGASAADSVTVYAAASLKEAFEAAAPAFTKASGGVTVRFNFGGSDALAAQLLQGAPADVFVAANTAQMQRVAALTNEPKTLAHNSLVVVVRSGARNVASLADLAKAGVKVVLAAPTVPAGAYARTALVTLAKDPAYGANYVAGVNANVVSEETDVKAVATKVALGEADAGIVYATDVTPQIASKVRVLRFPPATAPQATYSIAVLKAASDASGAKAFVDFITSPAGLAFLRARGFEE